MDPTDREIKRFVNNMIYDTVDVNVKCKIRDILRCNVCYEEPKWRGAEIYNCDCGHFFCKGCFKRLKHCGVCWARFHYGRKFLINDMLWELWPIFGVKGTELLPPKTPVPLPPGIFNCLHRCGGQINSVDMLQHLRTVHAGNVMDDDDFRPFCKKFKYRYHISLGLEQFCVASFHVQDMALFTVIIFMDGKRLYGSAHMLAKDEEIDKFECKISIKVFRFGFTTEFSVWDCGLFNYTYSKNIVNNSDRCLKVDMEQLCNKFGEGYEFEVLFCVAKKYVPQDWPLTPSRYPKGGLLAEENVLVMNNFSVQKARLRNLRRKRLREAAKEEQATEQFANKFRKLEIC